MSTAPPFGPVGERRESGQDGRGHERCDKRHRGKVRSACEGGVSRGTLTRRALPPRHDRRAGRPRGRGGSGRRDPAPVARPRRDAPFGCVERPRARARRAAAGLLRLEEALSGRVLPARPACERGRVPRQRLAHRRARARRPGDPRHPAGRARRRHRPRVPELGRRPELGDIRRHARYRATSTRTSGRSTRARAARSSACRPAATAR